MTEIYPTELKAVDGRQLMIRWSDGGQRRYSFRELRDQCPCAICRHKLSSDEQTPSLLPVRSESEARPLRVEAMKPVGNYAYRIAFSDGHGTGIYTFEFLRTFGEAVT
jgi:DUF971 family protein